MEFCISCDRPGIQKAACASPPSSCASQYSAAGTLLVCYVVTFSRMVPLRCFDFVRSSSPRGPPRWSSGQSSWLQIQRSGFDSRRYQIFSEVMRLERGPLSLVSTIEELHGSKRLQNREYSRRDPTRFYYLTKSWNSELEQAEPWNNYSKESPDYDVLGPKLVVEFKMVEPEAIPVTDCGGL
jgi:hypothetical protein